jgi:hypothetical protein
MLSSERPTQTRWTLSAPGDAETGAPPFFRSERPSAGQWFVEQPFGLAEFDTIPTPGPYGTLAEADLAADWLRAIVSGTSD